MLSSPRLLIALALAATTMTATGIAGPRGAQGIRGAVMTGPVCGVESFPPDPACADRKIAASLMVERLDASRPGRKFSSNVTGQFEISLPPGRYRIRSTTALPRCQSDEIVVSPGVFTDVSIRCDSGIR